MRRVQKSFMLREQHRRASCCIGRLCIAFIVADKWCSRQIQLMLTLRSKEHAWLWFPTFTVIVPAMRTIIDGINPAACLHDLPIHAVMDVRQICLGHCAASDSRLIRNHNHTIPGIVE